MRGEYKKTDQEKYAEFLSLWKIYSKAEIMKKVKITEEKFLLFLTKAIEESRKENDNFNFTNVKEPFSNNEDDYASLPNSPKKYNFLPIKKPKPTKDQ